MRYIGGKSKIAGPLSDALLTNSTSRLYYLEPFVGGGAVFERMAPNFQWSVAGDFQTDLVIMWNALLFKDWVIPFIDESRYHELKDSQPSAERALAGFGGSFGGKWFGGFARGGKNADGSPRNHQVESARSLRKTQALLEDTNIGEFRNWSYEQWQPIEGAVVYCDPPYADSQGYSTGSFDSKKFWDTMEDWSKRGCEVFVSEYSAPSGWDCVWEKSHRQSLTTPEQGRGLTVEKLFRKGGE